MKIAIGSDHAGFHYKESIKQMLADLGHECHDFGTDSDDSVDYPLFILPVAESVASGRYERGIVLGGSGNGEAIVANKVKGIRCTLCWNAETARLARQHNDANVLSLGARVIPQDEALEIVKIWLTTPFDGGRHLRRIKQIAEIESSAGLKSRNKKDSPSPTRTKKLQFQVDPKLKEPSVIHIPSEENWASEVPEWARQRREEILSRIRSKCAHMELEWKEY
ncbi:MAG: ribose-5-phosphate isomerase [Deltaproteobacteria bacterium]|nr:ribose-5-phosphate isomerase [Deltaproteobacteria bacterium]